MKYIPHIELPQNIKKGDIIEIKTLIPHEMRPAVSGKSKKEEGTPARFIEAFTAEFNRKQVFSAKLSPEISANPYISFFMKVTEPGTFVFTWKENNGQIIQNSEQKLKLE